MSMVFFALFLAVPRIAHANDGGADGGTIDLDAGDAAAAEGGAQCDDAGADDAGVCCSAGGACGTGDAGANGYVIACDGDLCDTLQGRPSCTVTRSAGEPQSFDATFIAAAGLGIAIAAGRRRRSGSRPRSGGDAC
jgi:hypothetical protein